MTRDQQRALLAHERFSGLSWEVFEDTYILVQGFGAQVMTSGLAAALDFVARYHNQQASAEVLRLLADGLGASGIEGLQAQEISASIRELELGSYMHATRETLKLVVWFKRAAQARKARGGR